MADNHLEFSEVLGNLTESEETWLKEQLQPIHVFGDTEYLGAAVPAELATAKPDWTGVRFLRTKRTTILSGMRWVSSTPFATTTTKVVGTATCGSTRKAGATPATSLGWSRSFSRSSGPASAGHSPTPPPARSPMLVSLAVVRCSSRPMRSAGRMPTTSSRTSGPHSRRSRAKHIERRRERSHEPVLSDERRDFRA